MLPKGSSTKNNYIAVTYFDSNLMLLSKRKCAVNKQRSIHATVKCHVTLAEGVLKSFPEPQPFHSHEWPDKDPTTGCLGRK